MERSLNIQTFGAVVVLATFLSAEAAAWYLISCPTHSLAWYLNLGPFHIFEMARGGPSALRYLFTPFSLPVTFVTLVFVLVARRLQFRLMVALASNLSFAFAIALVDAVLRDKRVPLESLFDAFAKQDFAVALGLMLMASFVGCVASHTSFIAAVLLEMRQVSWRCGRISPQKVGLSARKLTN